MSDRIVVMNEGRVEQSGTPEDLYHHPASRFVAEFIGEINLISGKVRAVDGERVALDWQGVTLHAASDRSLANGQSVTAAIRPERIVLSTEKEAKEGALQGQITKRVFKGSRTVLDIDVRDGAKLRAVVTDGALGRVDAEQVWIGWEPDSLTLLRD